MENPLIHCVAEFVATDELVVYEGKVFEAGVYPDKDFAIDEAELAAKTAAFQGVDLDLEHSSFKDVLGNKLGRLEAIWNRGSEAIGRLRVPRWLHDLAGGRLQTSLSFDRDKNIVGCALTLSPRIADAQVVAAFSCSRKISDGKLAEITRSPFLTPLHPSPPGSTSLHSPSAFAKAMADKSAFAKAMADKSAGLGSITNQMGEGVGLLLEKKLMTTSFKERLRVLFGSAPEALHEAGIDPRELDRVEFAEAKPALDPVIEAQLAEFRATNDRLIASQLNIAASIFAEEIVRAAKAVPAQQEHLISLYKTAAIADGHGAAAFTETGQVKEGPNLQALRDLFKDAQPHSLFNTQIANADPNAGVKAPDPAVVERLRSATSLGQQTTKREAK